MIILMKNTPEATPSHPLSNKGSESDKKKMLIGKLKNKSITTNDVKLSVDGITTNWLLKGSDEIVSLLLLYDYYSDKHDQTVVCYEKNTEYGKQKRIRVKLDAKGNYLYIALMPSINKGELILHIQFNPSKLSKSGMRKMGDFISEIIPESNCGGLYRYLHEATISRVDFAYDVPDAAAHYFFKLRYAKKQTDYESSNYLGSNLSTFQALIYDKKEHLESIGIQCAYDTLTRIEIRVRDKMPLLDLYNFDLSGLQKRLLVVPIDRLKKECSHLLPAHVVQSVANHDYSALLSLSAYCKRQLNKVLVAHQAQWWTDHQHHQNKFNELMEVFYTQTFLFHLKGAAA